MRSVRSFGLFSLTRTPASTRRSGQASGEDELCVAVERRLIGVYERRLWTRIVVNP